MSTTTWKEVFTEPYRWRTKLRTIVPWHLCGICLHGFWSAILNQKKGDDCEEHGGQHEWHNLDDDHSRCFHCGVEREGRLWPSGRTLADDLAFYGIGHLPFLMQMGALILCEGGFERLRKGFSDETLRELRRRTAAKEK